jgi:nucleotide-binding universal stress UspA family protein
MSPFPIICICQAVTMIRRLVVAVDFSDASARAIAAAAAVAERTTGAQLRLLHAESPEVPVYFTTAQLRRIDAERKAARRSCEEYLREFGRRHTSVPFTVLVMDRQPADAILHAGAEADLIAMGTHGRRGPSRWWLGSVAERVLRETATPLLVVHQDWNGSPGTLFSNPLLADGEGDSKQIPSLAAALAAEFHGRVTVTRPRSDSNSGAFDAESLQASPETTAIVAPMPHPVNSEWLAHRGEPLLQSRRVPVLFVPAVSSRSTTV